MQSTRLTEQSTYKSNRLKNMHGVVEASFVEEESLSTYRPVLIPAFGNSRSVTIKGTSVQTAAYNRQRHRRKLVLYFHLNTPPFVSRQPTGASARPLGKDVKLT